jgi:hypothetical protein
VNEKLQGNWLSPGQSYQMDSAVVTWAGWSLSGFTGNTVIQFPTPTGAAAVFYATYASKDGEDFSSLLKETPDSSGD